MKVLGIETSCDETSAAVVTGDREIKSNIIKSQIAKTTAYGGVVPEITARLHIDVLDKIIEQALSQANVDINELDGVAATTGPGLIGGVIVGAMAAKAIAAVINKPFLAVNHLAAHALTIRLTDNIDFPYLLMLVSGGHCQVIIVHRSDNYEILGSTMDDAVGEAFDKTGRLLGIPYPAGATIEKLAAQGNPKAYNFPRPLISKNQNNYSPFSFSFSGLKTAARIEINKVDDISENFKYDICASFQTAVGDILVNRVHNALKLCQERGIKLTGLVVAGGVAANMYLRECLTKVSKDHGVSFYAPPIDLCTDNGAMVAWAGIEKLKLGQFDSLDFTPRPRWPLNEL